MSYYTHVQFHFSDFPEISAILERARVYLTAQGNYSVEHVLEDLRRGLEAGRCDFKGMTSYDFEGLMESISEAFPKIRFHVRGMGEEYTDVWLRQFEGGKTIARTGPFEGA